MGDTNIGFIASGSGNTEAQGIVVGRGAAVNNFSPVSLTSAQTFLAELDRLRSELREQAEHGQSDVSIDDAIAALSWLQQHYSEQVKPADGDQRLNSLKRLQKVWTQVGDVAKQVSAGVIAGWILDAMN